MSTGLVDPFGRAIAQKQRQPITKEQAKVYALFHQFAQHFGLGWHCGRCGEDVQGHNNDLSRTFAVTCGCTERVYDPGSGQVTH